ncbi:MAG TPA: UDP-N-acetylmuramoyl-tripeptide--D-alanyl-D-alanine ligase [Bacillales bacterium]|nr:UDP-N-acetylmuramoyl-tripeptide--D-alanyl-D-alanine ligase [Bacillales bacterium]
MKWTRSEFLEAFPSHRGDATVIPAIDEVFIDSRKSVKNGLFVPIVGERFDGHDFLLEAAGRGATAALWQIDRPLPDELPADFPVFFVEDTTSGLQQLAKHHLNTVAPVVVAITGSNGKTTTKDMVAGVLGGRFQTHKTEGNFNNHIGLPLTVLAMPDDCDVLILEMGMNHFGEISALSRLAEPELAVITNIGESHIEFLGSREGIARAKMEITEGMKRGGKVIFDGDEPLLGRLRERPSVACGYGGNNDLRITSVEMVREGLHFSLHGHRRFYIPVSGKHNAKNAAFAVAVAKELGLPYSEIAERLADLSVTGMRFQQLQGKNGSLLINDAYNASPTSMKAAIETVREMDGYRRKVLVLGDIYELGKDEKSFHEGVAADIVPPITDVVTVGERARWIGAKVEPPVRAAFFATKEEAASVIKELLAEDTVVLFKASRAVGLETLVEQMKG